MHLERLRARFVKFCAQVGYVTQGLALGRQINDDKFNGDFGAPSYLWRTG